MDGKTNAEELITKMLKDPALLQSLAGSAKPSDAPADGGAPAA
jgi:type VI secretion system protein ImpB